MPSLDRGPTGRRPATAVSARHFLVHGHRLDAPRAAAGLHIVATPIGNLSDITIRALETLAGADAVLAEDSRVTAKLLTHYGISRPVIAYHDHNAAEMRPKILARLKAGEALALVSDAGTPLISDPGYKLVRDVVENGFSVTAIPGPSSVLAALVSAGLPTDRFFFEGFLPPKGTARKTRAEELKAIPGTLVFFESGPRLAASLADLAKVFGPRAAAIARELTKKFEEVRRGTLTELAAHYADETNAPKGEIVLLVAPPEDEPASQDDIDAALKSALRTSSLKDAVAEVTRASGAPKREVYQRALHLAKADE
jgi:16S rRNA (cytidine1402-2'-O)-methyltransferase